MQNEQQLCSKQGHEGRKLTHICIKRNSKNRYMCHLCVGEYKYRDYSSEHWDNDHLLYSLRDNIIEIDQFTQYFKEQRLPYLELQLKSQNGIQAKLKYLKKIYEEHFGDLGWFNDGLKFQKPILKETKNYIQELIDGYEREIKEAQLLNEIIQQLTLNGLQSLNIGQLDILLDSQCKFINDEFELYNQINIKLNKFDDKQYQIDENKFYLEYQKVRKIQKDLRKINDYLNFQKYSTDGKEFVFDHHDHHDHHNRYHHDRSFFSRNDRYYAMISVYINLSKLTIRQQNTLNVTNQLNVRDPWRIRFDPLFNYCIIQFHRMSDFYYYNLKNKQFKLIKKFKIKSYVYDFYLSNLNNMIIDLKDSIVIKQLNYKNKLINQIMVKQTGHYEKVLFSYGSERNIIAIYNLQQIKIYQETQKQPFLCQQLDEKFDDMKLLNKDSQLLTVNRQWWLWQIDYAKLKITLIQKIQRDINSQFPEQYIINQSEFNIIKFDDFMIEILDKNFVRWFSFSTQDFEFRGPVYLTKHILLIGNQVIKRRATIDYEKLQYE